MKKVRKPEFAWCFDEDNGNIFIETARKPRAFKLGDEWLPGA